MNKLVVKQVVRKHVDNDAVTKCSVVFVSMTVGTRTFGRDDGNAIPQATAVKVMILPMAVRMSGIE